MSQKRRFQRVVFIEPKSTHIHVYSAVHIPRIGSILLATLLRDKGYDVSVIVEDMLPRKTKEEDVWQQIKDADLFCVSCITSTIGRCYMWADRARAAGIPVVLGGTHVTYFPDESMQHADWVMRGECDEAFPAFIDAMEGASDLSKVPGLSWRDGGEVRHNPEPKLPTSALLESLPFPDYELLWKADGSGVASFAVARGCPFNCSFCSVTKFNGAAMRMISATRTLDMMEEHWKRYKPHYMFFAEDIFNLNKVRAKEIMRGLIDRRIRPKIGFGAQMRHEVVKDPEFLELLRAAGWDRAMVGFESVNQKSLDLCGKRQQVDNIRNAIREFHRYGVKVHGMFVGGFDTDTPQTFKDTLNFVKSTDLDSFQFMLLTPLPGTRDWKDLGFEDGSRPLLTRDWANFDGHHAVQVPKQMTAYEANILALKTMRRFYTFPRALKRLLKGDVVEFLMRVEGRSLINRWFKTPENIQYLQFLKNQLQQPATRWNMGELRKRVIIAHTETSIAFRDRFDKFFAELGITVEHSRAGLGELLTHGQERLQDAQSRMAEYLSNRNLFSRSETDLVVVPTDCGNAVDLDQQEFSGDMPVVVRLNINVRASVLAQQCVQIGMRFTNDVRVAANAFRRAMVDLAEPSQAT